MSWTAEMTTSTMIEIIEVNHANTSEPKNSTPIIVTAGRRLMIRSGSRMNASPTPLCDHLVDGDAPRPAP